MQNKELKITFVLIAIVALLCTVYFLTVPRKANRQTNFAEHKQTIEAFVEKNIEKIAPEKPILGGKWFFTELKFLTTDTVRVYYEDGHDTDALDLKITNIKGSQISYRIIE